MHPSSCPFSFYDVDGTFLRWQLFYELVVGMVEHGLLPKIVLTYMQEELEKYKDRMAPFKQFVDAAVQAYQGKGRMRGIRLDDLKLAAREVVKKNAHRVHVFPRELLHVSKECGYGTAFISGSPIQVVHQLALYYNVDAWIGTEHPYDAVTEVFTGEKQLEWVANKRLAVMQLVESRGGIDLERSVAIGDSESDIPMLEMVGFPIAFNPNEGLYKAARHRGWPVVREKKIITVDVFEEKRRREGFLSDILPEQFRGPMTERLNALEIYP